MLNFMNNWRNDARCWWCFGCSSINKRKIRRCINFRNNLRLRTAGRLPCVRAAGRLYASPRCWPPSLRVNSFSMCVSNGTYFVSWISVFSNTNLVKLHFLDGGSISLFLASMKLFINSVMDKFDNTNLLVNFVFSEITMEHMQNNEGRAPFEDLTNVVNGGNYL